MLLTLPKLVFNEFPECLYRFFLRLFALSAGNMQLRSRVCAQHHEAQDGGAAHCG